MPQQNDKITIMDVESPNSKEDQNLLLAPWGNNQLTFVSGDSPSPNIPKSPSSVFSFGPRSPGAGSNGKRYLGVNSIVLRKTPRTPWITNDWHWAHTDFNLYFHYLQFLIVIFLKPNWKKKFLSHEALEVCRFNIKRQSRFHKEIFLVARKNRLKSSRKSD